MALHNLNLFWAAINIILIAAFFMKKELVLNEITSTLSKKPHPEDVALR